MSKRDDGTKEKEKGISMTGGGVARRWERREWADKGIRRRGKRQGQTMEQMRRRNRRRTRRGNTTDETTERR